MENLDETPAGQDTSDEKKSSEGSEGATSSKTPTKEEHEKAISDLKAQHGRELKQAKAEAAQKDSELTTVKSQLEDTKNSLAENEKRLDELERSGIQDDPDKIKQYQNKKELEEERKRLKEERRQLETERSQHSEEIKMAKDTQWDLTVWDIASRHNVKAETLKDLGVESAEQLEKIAQAMSSTGTGQAKGPTSEFTPDSASGEGTGEPTTEQLEKMSQSEYEAYWRKRK